MLPGLVFCLYCLMDNHNHLLIETPDGNLSRAMRQLNGVFNITAKKGKKQDPKDLPRNQKRGGKSFHATLFIRFYYSTYCRIMFTKVIAYFF